MLNELVLKFNDAVPARLTAFSFTERKAETTYALPLFFSGDML